MHMARSQRACALLVVLVCCMQPWLLSAQAELKPATQTGRQPDSQPSTTKIDPGKAAEAAQAAAAAAAAALAKAKTKAGSTGPTSKQTTIPLVSTTKNRINKPAVTFVKPLNVSRLPVGPPPPPRTNTSSVSAPAKEAKKDTGRMAINIPNPADIFPVLAQVLAACPEEGLGVAQQTVLSMAAGMEADEACPAIRSWRQASPDCRVVVFTDNPNMRPVFMDAVGAPVNVHIIKTGTFPPSGIPWSVWRFWVFKTFLDMCRVRLDKGAIAITDVKDALALGNVWLHPAVARTVDAGGVLFTLDGNPGNNGALSTVVVQQHKATAKAVEVCFDQWPAIKEELWASPVSSNGLVIGAAQAMADYVNSVVDTFMDQASPKCWRQHGADKAVHTYLMNVAASKGIIDFPITRMANGESPFYNMAEARPVTIDIYGVFSVVRGSWGLHPLHIHGFDKDEYIRQEVAVLFECGIQPGWWGRLVHSSKRLGENTLFVSAIVLSLVVLASLGLALGVTLPKWAHLLMGSKPPPPAGALPSKA
mmetsp:Transcript_33579/g.85045  ORF Transcript_33579/g.85045 Transcript_33579/m.85045 type:complete len:533 (-) Transcript_33579:8-1606(-)